MTSQKSMMIVKMKVLEPHTINVCHSSDFFLLKKIYITPFNLPNYHFGGNYMQQVKNHWPRCNSILKKYQIHSTY